MRDHLPFRLAGLVILPDHFQAVLRPDDGEVVEGIIGAVKRNVCRLFDIGERGIWQSKFLDHRIRDERDFWHHIEYMRINPIKHGMVTDFVGGSDLPNTDGYFCRRIRLAGNRHVLEGMLMGVRRGHVCGKALWTVVFGVWCIG